MRRHGSLWPQLTSWAHLYASAGPRRAGKEPPPDVDRFLLGLEIELAQLRRELLSGSYRPGPYRTFIVRDGKTRLISAAPFRDRVVHHALSGILEPLFEARFVPHSYACRTGKGTHAALAAARNAAARYPYALSIDVKKYFASIDHQILGAALERVIKCRPTLALARTIIAASNPQEECNFYFPGDDLFTPFERRRGLPLGNQTSQFFANVYLNPLDHFVLRQIRPGAYMRYVDDLLLFGDDAATLNQALASIGRFAGEIRLLLHPAKSRVYRTSDGVTFLGWRIFPDRSRLIRENVVRFLRRASRCRRLYADGRMTLIEVRERIRAWLAHADHGDTYRLREDLLPRLVFSRPGPPRRV